MKSSQVASRLVIIPVVILATATTAAYLMTSGYLSLIWSTLVTEPAEAPRLSALTIRPFGDNPETYLWPWHLIAVISLVLTCSWFRYNLRSGHSVVTAIGAPMSCHLAWLFFASCMHTTGFMASMVGIVYAID